MDRGMLPLLPMGCLQTTNQGSRVRPGARMDLVAKPSHKGR